MNLLEQRVTDNLWIYRQLKRSYSFILYSKPAACCVESRLPSSTHICCSRASAGHFDIAPEQHGSFLTSHSGAFTSNKQHRPSTVLVSPATVPGGGIAQHCSDDQSSKLTKTVTLKLSETPPPRGSDHQHHANLRSLMPSLLEGPVICLASVA
jgi:hypothetical protein